MKSGSRLPRAGMAAPKSHQGVGLFWLIASAPQSCIGSPRCWLEPTSTFQKWEGGRTEEGHFLFLLRTLAGSTTRFLNFIGQPYSQAMPTIKRGWEMDSFNWVCGLSELVQELKVSLLRRWEENRFWEVTGIFAKEACKWFWKWKEAACTEHMSPVAEASDHSLGYSPSPFTHHLIGPCMCQSWG